MKTKLLIQNNISLRNNKSCESINEVYDFLDGKNDMEKLLKTDIRELEIERE